MIKNKRMFFLLISIITVSNLLAQVGINTDQPLSDLDVKGSTRITGRILTGGDDSSKGASGTKNMLLISQGEGLVPQWKEVKGFEVIKDEKWYLLGTVSKIDTTGGIILSAIPYPSTLPTYETGAEIYDVQYKVKQSTTNQYDWVVDDGLTPPRQFLWREFKNMDFTIPASNKQIRLMLSVQLPIQASWAKPTDLTAENWISCAFGVFKEGSSVKQLSLVASTQGGCFGAGENNSPTKTLTLIVAIDVPPSATDSKFRLLGTRRNNDAPNPSLMYMGTDKDGNQSDRLEFTRLTLKLDVFAQTQ